MLDYLNETSYSVLAPFIERFFSLIDKELGNERCTFEELFPTLCAFNMFSRNEVIAFVFEMLDTDNDQIVSQNELLKF